MEGKVQSSIGDPRWATVSDEDVESVSIGCKIGLPGYSSLSFLVTAKDPETCRKALIESVMIQPLHGEVERECVHTFMSHVFTSDLVKEIKEAKEAKRAVKDGPKT